MFPSILKSARWRYAVALGLVALLSVTSYLMLRRVISTQHGNAARINLSGRQRMLSQRSAFYASLLVLDHPPLQREVIRSTLKKTIELLEKSHETLLQDSPALYLGENGLDREMRSYIEVVRSLLATPDGQLSPDLPAYQAILSIGPTRLLQKLDAVVSTYERESENQVNRLETAEGGVLLLTLLLLLLEALFIFRPLIASLNKAWQEARDQTIRAEEAGKMAALGQMAGAIAHEVLNPVSNISLSADLLQAQLKRTPLDPQVIERTVSKIKTAAQRINKIILGLRHFAHPSDSEPPRYTSLREMIEETIDFALPRFKIGNVELRVKPFRHDLSVKIRPIQISQVLINLLNNAYDAVSSLSHDRWVEIEVNETDTDVSLSVRNGGPVISEETKEKIRAGFYTSKSPAQGTGLGLTISKRIIEEHRGNLAIESGTRNTTFSVTLPKSKERSLSA